MESPAKTFSDSHSTLQTTEANKNTVIVEFVYKEEDVSLDNPGRRHWAGISQKNGGKASKGRKIQVDVAENQQVNNEDVKVSYSSIQHSC